MKVRALNALKDNYIWIFNDSVSSIVCVDPGQAKPVLDFCRDNCFKLSAILLTHHHADHISGVSELKNAFPDVMIYGPEDPRIPITHLAVSHLRLGDYVFEIIDIPGHTSSHICYYEPIQHWLFCGDTLFSAGCGRVFDGTMQDLFHSICTLRNLPDETKVFCAHEYTLANLHFAKLIEPNNLDISNYISVLQTKNDVCSLPSTISLEKRINPFFHFDHPVMNDFRKKHSLQDADDYMVFKALRLAKDQF